MTHDPIQERDRDGKIIYVHYHLIGAGKLWEAPTRWWHFRRRHHHRKHWMS